MTESEWDRIFNELYLRVYAPLEVREQTEADAEGAARLAGCDPGADVLDAPCGYGRHSLVLAGLGYHVVGLDRSPVLLDEARRRGGDAQWPRWVSGDYRELPFADGSFDAVLHLFSSFGYSGEADDLRMFREFRRVLRPDGRLVVETMHRDRLVAIFQPRGWEQLPDGSARLDARSFDPVAGVNRTEVTYWPRSGEPISARYEVRIYTATEVRALLAEAGFSELEVFGSLEGGPFSIDPFSIGSRLVVVARA